MSNKLFMKLLSILLVLTMMFQLIPATVYASTATDSVALTEDVSKETETAVSTADETDPDAPVTILGEVEHLRGEDEKHFRMSDGSFLAVSYGMPCIIWTQMESGRISTTAWYFLRMPVPMALIIAGLLPVFLQI